MAVRVLVTGSRDWTDRTAVWRALLGVAERHTHAPLLVVHGQCPTGADEMAGTLARITEGWEEEPHPADWSRGPRGGPERNKHMVSLGASECVAFLGNCTSPRCRIAGTHDSHGTTGCMALATAAGIPVTIVRTAS